MAGAAPAPTKRVLVVGDNDMAGLAVVRSLGRAGLEVHLVAFDARPVTRHSRYVRRVHDFGHPLRAADAFAEQVIGAAETIGFDLVIPTSDAALVALMPQRPRIAAVCAFAAPDARGFETTHDKARTWQLARECAVAVPESVLVEGEGQIADALALEGLPLVLKPVRSVVAGRALRNAVRIARCADAAEQWLPEMLGTGPVLVQRFVPGVGVGLSVLGDAGRVVAAFQHRRVHEPPSGGASSYRVSEPLDPQLLEAVERMCRALAWSGPAMFEFKREPQQGRSVLIEINGRFWGSLPLAIAAGVDFPALLYQVQVLGQVPRRVDYRSPIFARYTPQEPYWLLANLRAPAGRSDLIRRSLLATLGELANLVRLREHWDLESPTDPLPALYAWRATLSGLVCDLREKWRSRRARRRFRAAARALAGAKGELQARLRAAQQILVLCHGNINRSAVAAERLRERFGALGGGPRVVSAGFVFEPGRATSALSRRVAAEFGVDLAGHRSRRLDEALLRESDLVLLMDSRNRTSLAAISPASAAASIPLGAFDAAGPAEIPDPYGEDADSFRAVYRRIIAACDTAVLLWAGSRHVP